MTEQQTPLTFRRQYSGPIDVDMVFDNISQKTAYLSSARRYAGQVVSCLEEEGRIFVLNNARDEWIEVSGNGPSGNFVEKTGDLMTGTLTISGADLVIDNGIVKIDVAEISTTEYQNIDTNTVLDEFPVSKGNCCFWDILINNGTDFRVSRLTAVWNSTGDNLRFNETSTECIGDTSGIILNVYFSNGNVALKAQAFAGLWNIRFIKKIL